VRYLAPQALLEFLSFPHLEKNMLMFRVGGMSQLIEKLPLNIKYCTHHYFFAHPNSGIT
jgi:hypothetical protein